MPVQRPQEFKNYGTPNTLRGAVRCNMVYVDFYNNAGQQQKRLVIERIQGSKVDYLELEGADRAMKLANPDLVKEVIKAIGRPPQMGMEVMDGEMEVEEVGELHVSQPGAH